MKKIIIMLLLVVSVVSCAKDNVEEQRVSNDEFKLEFKMVDQYNSIGLTTSLYDIDGNVSVIDSVFDDVTKTISVDIPSNINNIEGQFYNEDSDDTIITLYNVTDGTIVETTTSHQQIVNFSYSF